jgi:hypothetical protein
MNSSAIEHVRIVIDQNQESDQNNNTTSFLIVRFIKNDKNKPLKIIFFQRKVISIRPQETVRDLIKKCIDTSYLRVCHINLH